MSDEKRTDAEDKQDTDEARRKYGPSDDASPTPRTETEDATDDVEPADKDVGDTQADEKDVEDTQADEQATSDTESGEEKSDEQQAESSDKPVKRRGGVLAFFALLFALLGIGGVGYLYYELVYLQPLDSVRNQTSQLDEQYADLKQQFQQQMDALSESTRAAIEAASAEQAERLSTNEDAVLKSLQQALTAAPPSQREWKLAEAEYLMRIANHRVLMEQDSEGALNLLQAADQIMAELDDFALHQVRARLADEIIALRQVRRDDLQGIYLQLEAVKSQLENLPLPTPEYLQAQVSETPDTTVWDTLMSELKEFVRVRSLDGEEALQPLLAPDEAQYLELNLRLAVEQAQLATLKRQQDVFEQSLLNVRRWLVTHADIEDARTQTILEIVDQLLLIELARPLPEISGSLTELLEIRRGGS